MSTTWFRCYQCMKLVSYLFADARCYNCTRLTKEEIEGDPKINVL